MGYTFGELRGRGITSDALQTTLELQGYNELSELIHENKTFFVKEERKKGDESVYISKHVGANLVRKKDTPYVKYDLVVSLFAKELVTRAGHDTVYHTLTDFLDLMEGEDYFDYRAPAHTVLFDFQDDKESPFTDREGVRLRKRVEWTIMKTIKEGRAFTIASDKQVSKCEWYTSTFRSFLQHNLVKYEI